MIARAPALPPALAPWQRQLAVFPPDVALSLGPLVARLSLAIGAFHTRVEAGAGDPDGYEGLARRGAYERLLMTEWALLEEVPDEFLRRAAMGEHAFLRRAHKAPVATRHSLALFDAGPDQLGGPRIAQLAALIALAHRAESAGAAFTWGALQHPARFEAVTKESVLALLRSKVPQRAARADLDRWMTDFAERDRIDDVWLIGGGRLRDLAGAAEHRAAHLEVEDLLEPGPSRVVARVHPLAAHPNASATRIVLELPTGPAAARLLRDPFGIASAPRTESPVAIAPTSNILFAHDGRTLFVRGQGGALIQLRIPNSPRAAASAPRVFRPPEGHVIIGVGQIVTRKKPKKRVFVVSQSEGELFLHTLSKRGRAANAVERFAPALDLELRPADPEQPLSVLCPLTPELALFVDGAGRPLRLERNRIARFQGDEEIAIAAKPDWQGMAIVLRGAALVLVEIGWNGEIFDERRTTMPSGAEEPVFFGASLNQVAFRFGTGTFGVHQNGATTSILLLQGVSAVAGVVTVFKPAVGSSTRLLILQPDRRTVELVGAVSRETLCVAPAPITHLVASHAAQHVAYITEAGELAVLAVSSKALLLRVGPGALS